MNSRISMIGFLVSILFLAMPVLGAVDLEISELTATPDIAIPNDVITISMQVENLGNTSVTNALLTYSITKDGVVILEGNKTNVALGAYDKRPENFLWTPTEVGSYSVVAKIEGSGDVDSTNNQRATAIAVNADIEINLQYVTAVVLVDEYGQTLSPIVINGFITENGLGTDDGALVYIDGTLVDFANADANNGGYFESSIDGYFEQAGTYRATVAVSRNDGTYVADYREFTVRLAEDDEDEDEDEENEDKDDYIVDIEIEPNRLMVEAGNRDEYIIGVENLGGKKDTYEIDVNAGNDIDHMFTLEKSKVTLEPGEKTYISLLVDVDWDAASRSYPLIVKADGNADDIDRADFTVVERPNTYDLDIGRVTVSPDIVQADDVQSIAVSAAVTFRDISEREGTYVKVQVYVDGTPLDSQDVYMAADSTKKATFYIDVEDAPIDGNAGTYDVYMYASADKESDRSPTSTLVVDEAGEVKLTLKEGSVNTTTNGTIMLDVAIANTDNSDHTFTVSAENLGMTFVPNTIEVDEGETKQVQLKATVDSYEAPGDYTVTIMIADGAMRDTERVAVHVSEIETASAGTGATTGLLVGTSGGWLALLLAMALIGVLAGYYFYSKQDEDVVKHEGEGSENDAGAAAIAEALVAENKKPEKRPLMQRIKGAIKKDWTMHDVERTLNHPHILTNEFHQHYNEAQKLKAGVEGRPVDNIAYSYPQNYGGYRPSNVDVNAVSDYTDVLLNEFHSTLEDAKSLKGELHQTVDAINGKVVRAARMDQAVRPAKTTQPEYDAFGNLILPEDE